MGRLERKYLAHYIDSDMGQTQTNYVRLGKDLEEYGEELNPQVNVTRNIVGKPTVSFEGYQVDSKVESFYASIGDPLFEVLCDIANHRLNDAESCRTTKVDALFDGNGNQIWAYREDCWIAPVSFGGDTGGVQIPFNVYCAGNRTYGTFDISTKEFTPSGDDPSPPRVVSELRVYSNGTYVASENHSYNPVVVNVPPVSVPTAYREVLERTISTDFADLELTKVGDAAFQNCSLLSYVNLPSVSAIGMSAFKGTAITVASFPSCESIGYGAFQSTSISEASFPVCGAIGPYAFYSCSELETVHFPVCGTIESYAFHSCSKLETAHFPSCTFVGSSAFLNCKSLVGVSMPLCTSVAQNAFQACSKLEEVYMPKCTTIGSGAFNGCSSLTSITVSSGYISVAAFTFSGCSSLSEFNFSYVRTIYSQAFGGCGFVSVELPVCSTLSSYAFNNCKSLVYFSAPALNTSNGLQMGLLSSCSSLATLYTPTVAYVGSYALRGCWGLSSASFPLCVSIYNGAFASCYNLTDLYLLGTSVVNLVSAASLVFTSTPIFGYSESAGRLGSVHVPASLVTAYKGATNWAAISDRIVSYSE